MAPTLRRALYLQHLRAAAGGLAYDFFRFVRCPLLLPDTVDDYVDPDNPVRFIDAFVDSLDLAGAGFERAEPKETGRPGYDPSDLLKLYIYGYLNRVRSSRRLEAETHRNLEVIWLLRRLRAELQDPCGFPAREPGGVPASVP